MESREKLRVNAEKTVKKTKERWSKSAKGRNGGKTRERERGGRGGLRRGREDRRRKRKRTRIGEDSERIERKRG